MPSLSKRAVRAGVIALEIAGVLVAAATGLGAMLLWRLQSGPISLALFRDSAEFVIERALPRDHHVSIAKATLARGDGGYDLILDQVAIRGPQGADVANLAQIVACFSLRDVFRGAAGPNRIQVIEPVLRVERGADRHLSLAFAPQGAGGGNHSQLLVQRPRFPKAFKSAEFVRAQIFFSDAASGRTWRADGGEARILRTPQGYAARLDGVFEMGGDAASLDLDATYDEATGVIAADVHVVDAPIGDLLSMFYGPAAAVLSAPLTGDASIAIARSGAVLSSALKGRAEEGVLRIGAADFAVQFIDIAAAFDPAANKFDLENLQFEIEGARAAINGSVAVRFAENTMSPSSIGFDLHADNVVISAPGFFPKPMPIDAIDTAGAYDVSARRLSLANLRAHLLDAVLEGSLSFAPSTAVGGPPISPEIKADLKVDGALDRERLLLAWPLKRAEGARDFLATRMPHGEATNLALRMDLKAGAIVDGAMPDDAMSLTFDIVDATAIYTIGMTPVTNAFGSARLTGNRFFVDGARGRVGAIALSDGQVEFTAIEPRGEPVHYRFTARGAAKDMLGVLNEKPLELLKETKLDPAKFVGDAFVRADIWHPNLRDAPRETYGYAGKATFKDIAITEFYAGADITGAAGEVDLKSRSMTVTAKAEFAGSPFDFEWRQKFYDVDGGSEFSLSGVVDSSTGDVIGVPTRKLLRGPVAFEAQASGRFGALDALSINADFADASLMFEPFGWMKPQGSPAKGALDVSFGAGVVVVRAITLKGDGVDIEGAARLGAKGVVESASLPRFYLDGGADFMLNATRNDEGPLELAMTGAFLNAGPFFESIVEGPSGAEERKPFDWGKGVFVRSRIDDLALRAGARFRDAALDFRRGSEKLEALELSARTAAGAPISMSLVETGAESGPTQTIESRTDDIGAFMAGVFGVTSIRGGEGSMRIQVNPPIDGIAQGLSGLAEARHMRVVGAPLLARIFSAGSLTGLSDLLGGDGIELSAATAEFDFKDGVFNLTEARASGPSVGITASGSIARGGHGGVDLNGAVAPLYQFNSILGRAPVIGDLFVGREGEGVVALAYHVTGSVDAPTVAVNPLSALAPGFLRRMFDPVRDAPEEKAPSPEAPASN